MRGSKASCPTVKALTLARKAKPTMDARKFFELAYTGLIGFEVGFMVDLIAKLIR